LSNTAAKIGLTTESIIKNINEKRKKSGAHSVVTILKPNSRIVGGKVIGNNSKDNPIGYFIS